MEGKEQWLEQIAVTCSMTLSLLNKKAEEQGLVVEQDQLMSELCMGYLYLLNVCDTTGALDQYSEERIGTILNKTLH
jgi:hypothetical protein